MLQDVLITLDGKYSSMEELIEKATELLQQVGSDHNASSEVLIYALEQRDVPPKQGQARSRHLRIHHCIFGINTQDIRNLESTQWIFWTVAMPLTTLVVITSLLFAGILPPPAQWVRQKAAYDEPTGSEPLKQVAGSGKSKKTDLSKQKTRWSDWSIDTDGE
jgi:hypothetical protein